MTCQDRIGAKRAPQKGNSIYAACWGVNRGLYVEGFFIPEPVQSQIDQLLDRVTAVIAGDLFVQAPDAFDWIGLRRIFGQKVNGDPVAPLGQKLVHKPTVMKPRIEPKSHSLQRPTVLTGYLRFNCAQFGASRQQTGREKYIFSQYDPLRGFGQPGNQNPVYFSPERTGMAL